MVRIEFVDVASVAAFNAALGGILFEVLYLMVEFYGSDVGVVE